MEVTFKLTEIYESIQGESTLSGLPCTFIRLAGCPLRCRWCDTVYSFAEGTEKSIAKIIEELKQFGPRLVEITGGEPLAQPNVDLLCNALAGEGYKVMIETSGSFDISALPTHVHIVMDLKCPGSGMEKNNLLENLNFLKPQDDLKFVVACYEDFLWVDKLIKTKKIPEFINILISPAFGLVKPDELVSWMLETRIPARLNLQIHKYIWNPKRKGV